MCLHSCTIISTPYNHGAVRLIKSFGIAKIINRTIRLEWLFLFPELTTNIDKISRIWHIFCFPYYFALPLFLWQPHSLISFRNCDFCKLMPSRNGRIVEMFIWLDATKFACMLASFNMLIRSVAWQQKRKGFPIIYSIVKWSMM